MTPASSPLCQDPAATPAGPAPAPVSRRRDGRVLRALYALWSLFLGAVLCQSLVGGIVVVGWAQQRMRVLALGRWRRQSPATVEPDRAGSHGERGLSQGGPPWFVRQGGWAALIRDWRRASTPWQRARLVLSFPFGSLATNLRLGLQGLLATWTLTLPAGMVWTFAWHAGWNNSFYKVYEQSQVGALTGLLGVALFMVAMLYVPMAQARLAMTGQMRSFFEVPIVWGLIRRSWGRSVLLAALYSLASLPLALLVSLPTFFTLVHPATLEMSDRELLDWVNGYFFWVSALGFVLFLAVRLAAARVYAVALLRDLRQGEVCAHRLVGFEAEALGRLGLVPRSRPTALRPGVAVRGPRTVVRTLGLLLTLALWLTFTAQIFAAQFLNYRGPRAWLNQPLVQVPWLRFVPRDLVRGARETRSQSSMRSTDLP